jgi:hypothetical protein
MEDISGPVSPERLDKLLEEIKAPLREYEEEKRKSLEINSGFFEKLSALDAGSIAVCASIILAILSRSGVRPEWVPPTLHKLLIILGFLWLSLVFAVLHNFLAAIVAKISAALSEAQFTWTLAERAIATMREDSPDVENSVFRQVKDMLREQFAPRERKLVKNGQILHLAVSVVGYLSTFMFFVAFTLVPIFLFRLW